ncbi:19312_t:CDS:1, partial [Gigaspora margarita]
NVNYLDRTPSTPTSLSNNQALNPQKWEILLNNTSIRTALSSY